MENKERSLMDEVQIIFKSPCKTCICARCTQRSQNACDKCAGLHPKHECFGFKPYTMNAFRQEIAEFITDVFTADYQREKAGTDLKYPEFRGMASISTEIENLTELSTMFKVKSGSKVRFSIVINATENGDTWWFSKPKSNKRNIDEIPELETPEKQRFMEHIIRIIEKYIGCSYDERIKLIEVQTTFR